VGLRNIVGEGVAGNVFQQRPFAGAVVGTELDEDVVGRMAGTCDSAAWARVAVDADARRMAGATN